MADIFAPDNPNSLGRLSPLRIDTLLRTELYREIRNAQNSKPDDWIAREILIDEKLMPEKIAWRVYKMDTLMWVVKIAACLDDSRLAMEAGTTLYLPPATWIRERIKFYEAMQEQGGGA